MAEEEKAPKPDRFCSACGEPASPGSKFCAACGAPLRGATGASARAGWVVLVGFLAAGLAVWTLLLWPQGGGEPKRLPLAEKRPTPQGDELPPDHPAISLPDEVVAFISNLERQADAARDDAETWRNLARVQYRAGQLDASYLDRAAVSWEHVLELEPSDPEAIRSLGNIHFDRKEYDAARDRYVEYLEDDPDDPNVRTDLGTMYLYGGKPEDALREYEKVLESDPDFYQAWFNVGILHRQAGDMPKAVEAFENAHERAPDEETREQIGTLLARLRGEEPAADGAPSAAVATGVAAAVENLLRDHEIVGPRIRRFEWESESEGAVVLEGFPMGAMPDPVREKFLGRIEDTMREAGGSEPATVRLVDATTGDVMATVTTP